MLTLLAEADPASAADLLRDLLAAAQAGKWMAVVGVILMLLVLGLRIGATKWISKWFGTKLGGITLGFGTALLGSIGGSLAAGEAWSWEFFLTALSAAWAAAGIQGHLKDFLAYNKAKTTKPPE